MPAHALQLRSKFAHQWGAIVVCAVVCFAAPLSLADEGEVWNLDHATRLAESIDTLEQRVRDFPDSENAPAFLWKRAVALEAAGKVDEAIAVCEIVAREYPTASGPALLGMAAWHRNENRALECELACTRWFDTATNAERKDAALYLLAWSRGRLNKSVEAAETLATLVNECPESRYWADAGCRVAEYWRQAGKHDDAAKLLRQVIDRHDPQADASARLALALVLSQQNEWAEILDVVEPVCSTQHRREHYLPALFWRGEATFRLANYAEAEKRFAELEDAVDSGIAPQRFADDRAKWLPIAWLRRAQTAAQREEWTTVRELAGECNREFSGFPRRFEIDYVSARALMAEGKLDEAFALLGSVASACPADAGETRAAALWMRGECRMLQRRYPEAEAAYALLHNDASQAESWRAMAWLQAGKCHEQLSKWPEARRCYEQAATLGKATIQHEAHQRLAAVDKRGPSRTEATRTNRKSPKR